MCADTDEPDIRDRSDRPARCAQQAGRAVRSTDAVPSALVPPLPDAEPDRMARLDRLSASDLLTLQSGEAGWQRNSHGSAAPPSHPLSCPSPAR